MTSPRSDEQKAPFKIETFFSKIEDESNSDEMMGQHQVGAIARLHDDGIAVVINNYISLFAKDNKPVETTESVAVVKPNATIKEKVTNFRTDNQISSSLDGTKIICQHANKYLGVWDVTDINNPKEITWNTKRLELSGDEWQFSPITNNQFLIWQKTTCRSHSNCVIFFDIETGIFEQHKIALLDSIKSLLIFPDLDYFLATNGKKIIVWSLSKKKPHS